MGMWEVIREPSLSGATSLLTTQYLEEADALADAARQLAWVTRVARCVIACELSVVRRR